MTETTNDTLVGTPDANWAVAKWRMEMAYNDCLNVANPPDKGLAAAISRIYQYGEASPAARPYIITLLGTDRD